MFSVQQSARLVTTTRSRAENPVIVSVGAASVVDEWQKSARFSLLQLDAGYEPLLKLLDRAKVRLDRPIWSLPTNSCTSARLMIGLFVSAFLVWLIFSVPAERERSGVSA
jgi:hypothetical protein